MIEKNVICNTALICKRNSMESDEQLVFSDEVTFHTIGKVNKYNVRRWGEDNPHAIVEQFRDSSKMKCLKLYNF